MYLIGTNCVPGFQFIQQDGGVSFRDAWMHLTDEYPIKYEAERLPPPLVADLNGDGKKEVLVATHDAKIQVQFISELRFLIFTGGSFASVVKFRACFGILHN